MLQEFKKFIMKGNILDLAVAVVIGGAFRAIVNSLVNDLIMPLIGLVMGGKNVSELKYVIEEAAGDIPEVAFRYGAFIQSIIDFLIIAFTLFLIIKLVIKFQKKEEEAPAAPPEPTKEETLLTEIRDLLKEKN